jgi:hypothetical protein
MGYWLVALMATCAAAATVLVLVAERSEEAHPKRQRRGGSLRWVAFAGKDADAAFDWFVALRASLPDQVAGQVVPAGDRTLGEIAPVLERALDEDDADVVVIWVAMADLLTGISLEDHERSLYAVLGRVRARQVIPVVGGVPDLATWRIAEETGLPGDELGALVTHWNAAIDRVVYAAGGLTVDLGQLDELGSHEPEEVARRFLPAVRRALVLAHRRADQIGPVRP